MFIPKKIPYLRLITLIWAGFALVWLTLEGSMPGVVGMGVGTTAVVLLQLLQKAGGRRLSPVWRWVLATTGMGFVGGAAAIGFTLLFMALKTGLHAHGPEFTGPQISWVIDQLPLWATGGGLMGSGLGLIVVGVQSSR